MFPDLSSMMDKLQNAQQNIEETKKRLDTVLIDACGNNNKIKITLSGNRVLKSIEIDNNLLLDKEELEDSLILAFNSAIEKANKINDTEMAAAAKKGIPNIPGMDIFK